MQWCGAATVVCRALAGERGHGRHGGFAWVLKKVYHPSSRAMFVRRACPGSGVGFRDPPTFPGSKRCEKSEGCEAELKKAYFSSRTDCLPKGLLARLASGKAGVVSLRAKIL